MSKKEYHYIVWDWNGTLYDDVVAGVDTINTMLVERSIMPLSVEKYREIFGFPIIDYYKRAGFDFDKEPYEKLASIFIERNNLRLGESTLFPDVRNVLKSIKSKNIHQIILSATRKDILREQIGIFDIDSFFIELLGNDDFYAYSKAVNALNFIKSKDINANKILLIGDTLHDFEVSKAVGCDCLLVSRGHQNRNILSKSKAKVLNNLEQVLDFL